jgi:hypothetical protein
MGIKSLRYSRYVLTYLSFDKDTFRWFPRFENTSMVEGRYNFMSVSWLWFAADFQNMSDYYRETQSKHDDEQQNTRASELWDLLHELAPFVPSDFQSKVQAQLDAGI